MPPSHTGTTPLKGADLLSGELAVELSCLGSSVFSIRNCRGTCVSPVLPPVSESGPWGGGPGFRRVLFPTLAQWPEGVVTSGLERQVGPSLGSPCSPTASACRSATCSVPSCPTAAPGPSALLPFLPVGRPLTRLPTPLVLAFQSLP